MEKKVVRVILLQTNQKLISEIQEVGADIGQPDCKLVCPMEICEDHTLRPWMLEHTQQDNFMINSDKIITLADPMPTLLEKYIDLTK